MDILEKKQRRHRALCGAAALRTQGKNHMHLRVAPAVAVGVSDRLGTLEELLDQFRGKGTS
jgi:hypothetical protein